MTQAQARRTLWWQRKGAEDSTSHDGGSGAGPGNELCEEDKFAATFFFSFLPFPSLSTAHFNKDLGVAGCSNCLHSGLDVQMSQGWSSAECRHKSGVSTEVSLRSQGSDN